MSNQKGLAGITMIIVFLVAATFVVVVFGDQLGIQLPNFQISPTQPLQCADPGTSRTVTVSALDDNYNPGTAVTGTSTFYYRKSGDTAWTAAGGSFSATAGAVYELALGTNSSSAQTALPQPVDGPIVTATIPCDSASTLEYTFTNDELATSLTAQALDGNDGNVITATDTIDIDAGSPVSIAIDWYAGYEENFGTLACGAMSNVYVVRVNTTTFDDVDLEYNGVKLSSTTVPGVVSSASGMKDYAFMGPVIESTKTQGKYPFTLILDPDDTTGPDGTDTNTTVTVYDSFVYYDSDNNQIKCGVEDEDQTEIGAAAADVLTIYTECD